MKPTHLLLSAIAMLGISTIPALSSTPEVWVCDQATGTSLYTNKERAGCRAMELKPLSIVETPPASAHIPPSMLAEPAASRVPPLAGWGEGMSPSGYSGPGAVPDWGRNWHAQNTMTGSVQEEICTRYAEWTRLNERTRGGIFYGSDPSYGGDPSGSNLTTPSYSFYDNARWLALTRMFGTGFVPVGCP